jgi:hypothetical protein
MLFDKIDDYPTCYVYPQSTPAFRIKADPQLLAAWLSWTNVGPCIAHIRYPSGILCFKFFGIDKKYNALIDFVTVDTRKRIRVHIYSKANAPQISSNIYDKTFRRLPRQWIKELDDIFVLSDPSQEITIPQISDIPSVKEEKTENTQEEVNYTGLSMSDVLA